MHPSDSPAPDANPFPHLPSDREAAGAWNTQLNAARRLIATGAYHGRLSCVLGVEKSASRRLTAMLAELRGEPSQRHAIYDPGYSPSFRTFELRPETAAHHPAGGVLHLQCPLTTPTLAAMRALGTPYVVVLRHPADQVCAYTCFTRYLRYTQLCRQLGLSPVDKPEPPEWREQRAQLSVSRFIRRALPRALSFMADWLDWHRRDDRADHPPGCVLRFEDFIADPRQQVSRVHRSLHGEGSTADRLDGAMQRFELEADTKARHDLPGVYPPGGSGRAGLFREMFDADAAEQYRRVVHGFDAFHPGAELIGEHYADWLDPR